MIQSIIIVTRQLEKLILKKGEITMFKLLKYLIVIVVIGIIINMFSNDFLPETSEGNDFQFGAIVDDFKDRIAQVDLVEFKDRVQHEWENLKVLLGEPVGEEAQANRTDESVPTAVFNGDTSQFEAHEFELEVLNIVNEEREKHQLPPLQYSEEVSVVARDKSLDMAMNGYFDHESPTFGSPFEMMEMYGVTYWMAGENIAKGHLTPEHVMEGWMNSEGHRANILKDGFTHLGVGFIDMNGTYYWTQMFIGK